MFKKLRELIKEMEEAYVALNTENELSTKLQKQNKELLSKIETAEKRGGILLLSELNEDLIAKLQELTDDNIVILFLEKDGTRIEIRQQGINYKRNNGNIF